MHLTGVKLWAFVIGVTSVFVAVCSVLGLFLRNYLHRKFPRMQFARGVMVPDTAEVQEGYDILERENFIQILINVSIENLMPTFFALGEVIPAPGFGIIEVPATKAVEEELAHEDTRHNFSYHLPQITFPELRQSLF